MRKGEPANNPLSRNTTYVSCMIKDKAIIQLDAFGLVINKHCGICFLIIYMLPAGPLTRTVYN